MTGGHSAVLLHGADDHDILSVGIGHDTLMGRAGDDLLIGTDLKCDNLKGGERDDSIHSYGADDMTDDDGADMFVYTDVGYEPIEITDCYPTVVTMAIQFQENDIRDISGHPVSADVYEIRLGNQVAAHIKSTAPFDVSSIVVQTHT